MTASTSRALWRDALIPAASFACVFVLPESWITAAFLAVGQAHFAVGVLYQYRSGKIGARYAALALALLALLTLYFVLSGAFYPIFLVAACLFGAHFAFDEFFLHGEEASESRVLTVLSFTALYFSLILYTSVLPYPLLPLAAAAWLVAVILVRLARRGPSGVSRAERYLWLVGGLLALLVLLAPVVAQTLLALVILLHCFNWYADYGRKLADRGDRRKLFRYWREVGVSLGLSFGLYFLYIRLPIPILAIAFLPAYYDAWALGHFMLSLRLKAA